MSTHTITKKIVVSKDVLIYLKGVRFFKTAFLKLNNKLEEYGKAAAYALRR